MPKAGVVTRRTTPRGYQAQPQPVIATVPFDPSSLLVTLRDLGVVWETASGVWEMGIPSFADYILRRSAGT